MLFQLSQWWNLIFVVPFCCGVMLVLLSLTGSGRHGRGAHRSSHRSSHRNINRSAKHHAPHKAAHKAAHAKTHKAAAKTQRQNTEQNTQKNTQQSAEQKAEPWSVMRALNLPNIPSQMLLQNFLLFWGVVGWTCNQIASQNAFSPARFVTTSIFAALIGGSLCTLLISATIARFMPDEESLAIYKADLEGHIGEAISFINERSGSVRARDNNGTLHQLAARVRAENETIARGDQVLIVSYFAEEDYFQVKKWSP